MDAKVDNFEKDLSDSAFDFLRVVEPKLIEMGFIDGEIISIESTTQEHLAKQMDMTSGIDAWVIKTDEGITGLASRIQWINSSLPFNTFTIRQSRYTGAKTEYEKRLYAINSDGEFIYPHLTCQAYITRRQDGDLISLAIAKTVDIFRMIADGHCWLRSNPEDNNEFMCVSWKGMSNKGYSIKIWGR